MYLIKIFSFIYFIIFSTLLYGQKLKATITGTALELPDLVPMGLYISPKNPSSREWFRFSVDVCNFGKKSSMRDTVVYIFVGGSNKPYIFTLNPVEPRSRQMFAKWIFLSAPGKYAAKVVVDPHNRIKESIETNNSKDFKFTVRKAENNEYLPDLLLDTLSWYPKETCKNVQIEFKAGIKNIGAVNAPKSKAAINVGNRLPFLIDVPEIPPVSTRIISVKKTFSIAKGYNVIAYADWGNKIREYSERNNKKSKSLRIIEKNCCTDLALPAGVWVIPKYPTVGTPFRINVRIHNFGKKEPVKSTTLHLYIDGSTVPYMFDVAPIAPRSSRWYYRTFTFTRPGKYTARAVIDPDKKIAECRKDNNTRQTEFRVK